MRATTTATTVGSAASRDPVDAERFARMEVHSLTGVGAEKAAGS